MAHTWTSRTARKATIVLAVAAMLGLIAAIASACPAPTITSKPADPTRSTVAQFSFVDGKRGVTFVCSLDGSDYRACSPPTTYRGLSPRRHTFAVKARNAAGATSVSTSYSWTIDRKPASIKIAFPVNRRSYSRSGWSRGCGGRRAGVCGTATDSVGAASVRVSIKQNATGRYWNGRRFTARREVYLRASLAPRKHGNGSATTRNWFYALRVPSPDGSYTFHVRAVDKVGNATRRRAPARSIFTIDTRRPAVAITSYPSNPSTSPNGRFTFRANEPRVRFWCRLDGRRSSPCAGPITYRGLGLGTHTFTLVALDAAGNASTARYSWRIVSSVPLHLSADLVSSAGLLYPGADGRAIPVTLNNTNGVTIYVTAVTVSVQSAEAPGCSTSWFRTTPASIPREGVAVPPHRSVTLPAQGAIGPSIQMIESGTSQDVCKNTRLSLVYGGSAHS